MQPVGGEFVSEKYLIFMSGVKKEKSFYFYNFSKSFCASLLVGSKVQILYVPTWKSSSEIK